MKREDVEAVYRLTPLQEGMLFHAVNEREPGVYVQQFVITIEGDLEPERLRDSWDRLIARYSVLRTLFAWRGVQQPVQIVRRQAVPEWRLEDWRDLPAQQTSEDLRRYLEEDRDRGFDLTRAPLLRFALFRTGPRLYRLVWTFHHILLDGWSGSQVLKEWLELYRDPACELPPTLPFKAVVEAARKQRPEADRYWENVFPGPVDSARLVLAPPKAAARDGFPDPVDHYLDNATTRALSDAVRRLRVTANALLASAWALLLAHHVGRREIVFGMVCSGRSLPLDGIETCVGLTINTLPIRLRVDLELSVSQWVAEVHHTLGEALRHEHGSLPEIVARVQSAGGPPLFDTLLAYENYPEVLDTNTAAGGIRIASIDAAEQGSTPLSLSVTPGERLLLRAQFNHQTHDADAIAALLRRLGHVLEQIVSDPAQPLAGIQPLAPSELRQSVSELNRTAVPAPGAETLHDAFAAQCRLTPDRPALLGWGNPVTFSQLDHTAETLAARLVESGIGEGSVVAVYSSRCPQAVAAMLAVLKSGAAYMPVDRSYPPERVRHMLSDSGAKLVLAEQGEVAAESNPPEIHGLTCWTLPKIRSLTDRDTSARPSARAVEAAYVIYTSGSTGTPKGVVGTHSGCLNRFRWMYREFPFANGEVACQKTALSFVDSVWETFGPLLAGVPLLVLGERDVLSPPRLLRTLARHRVSRLVLVPTLLRVLLDGFPDLAKRLPSLGLCIVSGESLPAELARRFRRRLPSTRLLNLYGSSEVSADVTCFDLEGWDESETTVPIGRPIANNRVYILNDQLQPLPPGVPGELYIAGAGLAAGYRNQPERTRERFLDTEIDSVGREQVFRTGDWGRLRRDGNIDFMGRGDRQLKIHGVRIEPGEIESILLAQPGVRAAMVDATRPGEAPAALTAWVETVATDPATVAVLRGALQRRLPPAMVPERFIVLERLPLLPNGKVDRSALPLPATAARPDHADPQTAEWAPQRALTVAMTAMFERVLGVAGVEHHSDFFEIGGASLSAMRLLSEIAASYHVELSIDSLFDNRTPHRLAQVLLQDDTMPTEGSLVPIQRHGRKSPLFCVYGDAYFLAKHLAEDRPFYWLTPWPRRMRLAREPHRLQNLSVSEIAVRYLADIRRVQPQGPYQLSGSCAGAVVAMEIARQLRAQGQEVTVLALFDLPATRRSDHAATPRRIRDKLMALRADAEDRTYFSAIARYALKYGSQRLRLRARVSSIRVRYHILTGTAMSLALARRYTNEKVYNAISRYRLQPHEGKALLFRTREWAGNPNSVENAEALAHWAKLFPRDLIVHNLEAPRHDDLFREPYVRELADKLRPHLQ